MVIRMTNAETTKRPPQAADDLRPLTVSVRDAASLTGLGRSTIWKLIGDGTLLNSSVGRKRLVIYSSLEALVLNREEPKPRQSVCRSFHDELSS
jgi:excisionase family DNA binding protein